MNFLRVRIARSSSLVLAACGFAVSAQAQSDSLPGFFYDLGPHIGRSFTGGNLALQTGAMAATWGIVETGTDYQVHRFFNRHEAYGIPGAPSASVGGLAPILGTGALWIWGRSTDQPEIVVAGNAVGQAVAIAFTWHELLKAVTGRPAPQGVPEDRMDEHSREFRFGFLRGGLFWGWPSGHLITNTAAVTSLAAFYPDNTAIQALQYGWIGYMFYGVVSHNGASMHWFSDAVAGTMMGIAFGRTVGGAYRERLRPTASGKPTLTDRVHIYPTTIASAPGLGLDFDLP